jgi:DNA primase
MHQDTDVTRELKRELVDVRAVCIALGLAPRKEGAGFKISCLWHEEKTPSCHVRIGPDGTIQVWCHACSTGGDVYSLIAATRGLSPKRDFPEVLREAATIAGRLDLFDAIEGRTRRPATPRARKPATNVRPALPPIETAPTDHDRAMHAAYAVLANLGRLDDSAIAADVTRYLADRGLLELARAERWFALPLSSSAPIGALRDVLGDAVVNALGLLHGGAFTFAANRLCIPWRLPDGTVYTIQRRRLDGQKENKYVFPKDRPARLPYGIERLAAATADAPIAFTEGSVDALARSMLDRQHGHSPRVVLGVPGTGGWDERWATFGRERVCYVATDADNPGENASQEWAADLYRAGASRVIRLAPVGANDWGDIVARGKIA